MGSYVGDNPIDERGERERERRGRYLVRLDELRGSDPRFAEASAQRPADETPWQAAVYLLSGCRPMWSRLGAAVIATNSLAPITTALGRPAAPRGSSERTLMDWAAYLGQSDATAPPFPDNLSESYFRRWLTALELRRGTAPA